MYCKKCGAKLPDHAAFCSNCRTKQNNYKKTIRQNAIFENHKSIIKQMERKKEQQLSILGILFIVSIFSFLICCFILKQVGIPKEMNPLVFFTWLSGASMFGFGCGMIKTAVYHNNRILKNHYELKTMEGTSNEKI